MEEGLRFNQGKTRHDLIPAYAQEQYAKVLTKGSEKYQKSSNWEEISYICTCENHPAIPIDLIIVKAFVETATKSSLGIQTLNMLIDKELIVEIGGSKTNQRKSSWTSYTQPEIKSALKLAKLIGLSESADSPQSLLKSFLMPKGDAAPSAEAHRAPGTVFSISTTIIPPDLQEGSYAEPVTWESACSEIANRYLKKHSSTCKIRLQKYSWDNKLHRFYIPGSGDRNWEKGMAWSKVIASMKRHVQRMEEGEDFDPETGCLHAAHIMCNAAFLTQYYKTYPQGDDRPHAYLNMPRIGLDIDEVLADWVGHWTKHHKQDLPEFWNFDRDINSKFEILKDDMDFWLSIPPKISPAEMPFEPVCYVTSRIIPTVWTEKWLAINGFPAVPVITVGHGVSKVEELKKMNVDIFVDDRFDNFVDINKAGICCFLMDAPHNRRYNVGYKRISTLKELV